jgi:hypothetical protein
VPKPATVTVGNEGNTAIRVEYVRHRRVLRLWGCHDRQGTGAPVEVPVQALVELGVDTDELVAPHRFLLFGGEGEVRGGARDLIATYDSEALARTVFIELRRTGGADWAELVAVAPRGGLKRLAWFGPRRSDVLPVPTMHSVFSGETNKPVQATKTLQDSKPAHPSRRRRRSTRLRLIVASAITVAAAGGVVGGRAVTHSSSTPAHVVGPSRSSAAIDTGDDVVRRGPQSPVIVRTTVVPPATHAPLDVNADQAQFAGPGGD